MMNLTNRENKDFWLYYIAFPFCWAMDHAENIMLSDYITESYDFADEEWCKNLTGGEDEPWQGTTLRLKLSELVSLNIEFHYDGTLYFLNDTYIGEQSGHAFLSVLQWKEVKEMTRHTNLSTFLLLPLTVASNEDKEEIREYLLKTLGEFVFLESEDVEYFTTCLLEHIVDEEEIFFHDDDYGIICSRNHSLRNPKSNNNTLERIQKLNKLIELAMQK